MVRAANSLETIVPRLTVEPTYLSKGTGQGRENLLSREGGTLSPTVGGMSLQKGEHAEER